MIWCGASALEGAVPLVVGPALLFALLQRRAPSPGLEAKHGGWWFLYLGGLLAFAELGARGRPLAGAEPLQLLLVAGFALAIYGLAVRSRLPEASAAAGVPLLIRR